MTKSRSSPSANRIATLMRLCVKHGCAQLIVDGITISMQPDAPPQPIYSPPPVQGLQPQPDPSAEWDHTGLRPVDLRSLYEQEK